MPLANIDYVNPGEDPTDPGYGQGHPKPPHAGHPLPPGGISLPPIQLPPLQGIWPPKGQVTPPIHYPPAVAVPPIFIPEDPQKPLPPPGLWPPLPPDAGINGKVAILVWVIGVGYRWFVYEAPPVATPK